MTDDKGAYSLFADLLAYPQGDLPEKVRGCLDLLRPRHQKSAAAIQKFLEYTKAQDLGRLQELYTHTFDLNPVCSLYIGYHLYGESFRRGEYMARLKGAYRAKNLDLGNELPDHLSLVLRYLSASPGESATSPIVTEDLAQALEKMIGAFEGSGNAYGEVIRALRTWLADEARVAVPEGGA